MTLDKDDPRSLRRNTDPITSAIAAVNISPKVSKEVTRTWTLLRSNQHSTSNELAALAGDWDIRKVGRRLSDGESKYGMIIKSGQRKCKITGNLATTWYALDPQDFKPPTTAVRGTRKTVALARRTLSEEVTRQIDSLQYMPEALDHASIARILKALEERILGKL
jgi:hypothetical protein